MRDEFCSFDGSRLFDGSRHFATWNCWILVVMLFDGC